MNERTKLVRVNYEDYLKFCQSKTLSEVPFRFKQFFQGNRHIGNQAKIIESKYFGTLHYILTPGTLGLIVYYVEIDPKKSAASDSEILYLKITNVTPTFSDNINDYPIYMTGIPLKQNGKVTYISGEEREKLDREQLQRWDYFFRASTAMLELPFRELIENLESDVGAYRAEFQQLAQKAGIVVVAAILVYIFLWKWLAIPIALYGLYKYRNFFNSLLTAYSILKILRGSIEKLEEEMAFLKSQVYQEPASEADMRKWLNDEILLADKKAQKELNLPEELIDLDTSLKSRSTSGLNIEEWGTIQSPDANGKKTIEKRHFFHQLGFRMNDGKPMYAIYYIYFIYLTPEMVGIYGYFLRLYIVQTNWNRNESLLLPGYREYRDQSG